MVDQEQTYNFFSRIEKPRLQRLVGIAWPVTVGMLASNLLTLIDTGMVGSLGPTSLSAVAVGGVFSTILVTTVLGLGIAVQAITARRIGQGEKERAANPLHGGLVVASTVGLLVAVLGHYLAPLLIRYYPAPKEVLPEAISYFKMLVWMIPGLGMNAAFRGFFNGIGRTKIYLFTLCSGVGVNIFFNWVFIFGNLGAPALGTEGAALATVIAVFFSTVIYTFWGFKIGRPLGFGARFPAADTIKNLVRLAVPSMTNQLLTSFGSMVYFGIISTLGTVELAATTIVFRLAVVLVLPAFGLGMGGATLVGQALGAGNRVDAKSWGWDTVKLGAVILTLLGLPMVLVPDMICYIFVQDAATIEMAAMPMRLVGITMGFNGCGVILIQCLNGSGDNKFVLKATGLYQWCLGLPFIATVALYFKAGLTWVWVAQVINYFIICNVLAGRWRSGLWADRKI